MPLKSSIAFGLVFIPVSLVPAVKSADIGFNMLHKKYKSRIKYKKTCPECEGEEVAAEDIVKGYQYDKDKYVIFEDGDFEKLKTPKDKSIAITQFVELKDIDPVYFDRAYYAVPTGAEKAYALLTKALAEEKKVGIAKTVLGTKETLIALSSEGGGLRINTMHFADEIAAQKSSADVSAVSEPELKLAKTLIESMSGKFEPFQYKDEYRERLLTAIEDKINGKEIVAPKAEGGGKVIDLMEALRMSIAKKGESAEESKSGASEKPRADEKKGRVKKKKGA